MFSYLSYAVILGLSAGISPGPLFALVVAQTLQHGTGEGIKVAIVPVITDLPIIALAFLLIYSLPDLEFALGLISFVGAAFILHLGINSLRTKPDNHDFTQDLPRSYVKGVLVNALSPHPYLFWFSVGVPTIIKAAHDSLGASVAFVIGFFTCLVGTKVMLALFAGRSREFLSGPVYRWVMQGLGVCLIGFSILLIYEGFTLTGIY